MNLLEALLGIMFLWAVLFALISVGSRLSEDAREDEPDGEP